MPSRKKLNPPAPSIAEIAAALGVTGRRVSQLKADGMPSDTLADAIAWRTAQAEVTDSAEELRQQRIKLVREQRIRAQLHNQVRRGELVEAGQVRADCFRITSAARGELLKLASDLPPSLEGLDAAGMQRIIRDAVHEILTRLSDEMNALYADPASPTPSAQNQLA